MFKYLFPTFFKNYFVLSLECLIAVFLAIEIFLRITGIGVEGDIELHQDKRTIVGNFFNTINERYDLPSNSYGLRDYEYPATKSKDALRILVLGNEQTSGYGIKIEDIYPKQLENLLNLYHPSKRFTKYEVLNFGKIGLNTIEESRILSKNGFSLKPDILILSYALTDPADYRQAFYGYFKGDKNLAEIVFSPQDYIYYYPVLKWSMILRYFYIRYAYSRVIPQYINYINNMYTSDKWTKCQLNLEKIINSSRLKNIRIMAVIMPVCINLDAYPFRDTENKADDFFKKAGVPTVKLSQVYSQSRTKSIYLTSTTFFPSEYAHKIASEEVYKELLSTGFLK